MPPFFSWRGRADSRGTFLGRGEGVFTELFTAPFVFASRAQVGGQRIGEKQLAERERFDLPKTENALQVNILACE